MLASWALLLPRLPASTNHYPEWGVILVGLLVLVAVPLPRVARWWTSYFVVTSDRVIHREGIIGKSSMEIPLEAINDVRFEQSVIERLLGAGDLVIQSASESGREVFSDIRHPEDVQRTIYHQGELNQQRMYAGGTRSAADELTRLADLRDRGALTSEEFEAQKRRILGT
ncbi:MAG: PH domain-containing protein [Chloroflexota bacterium]